jgi:plastocyanin
MTAGRRAAAVLATLAGTALVLVAGAGSADAPTRTVTMPGKLYDPTQLSVLVGTSVTWKNDDSVNHTVTADGDAFASGYVPPGGTFTFTFAKQGHYAFHCTIHKFMRGEIDVFGLVLSGPEGPVPSGQRVVFAGLAPPGTSSVTLRGGTSGDRVVRARPDGSFVAPVTPTVPGTYRAVAGRLVSPAVRVQVKPAVLVVHAGTMLRVRARPARPGAAAILERYDRDHFAWYGIARGKLDGRSRVAFSLPAGLDRVRVVVVGAKGWADGVSRTVRLRGAT